LSKKKFKEKEDKREKPKKIDMKKKRRKNI
jgi:hypothetical protein